MNYRPPWLILCFCSVAVAVLIFLERCSHRFSGNDLLLLFRLKDGSNAEFNLADVKTIIALFCAAVGASISSAGGIGGGGLFVPMFNLLLRFNTRTAAVLSNFMIFGGMAANMLWSSFQRDPFDPDRPLIDFDAALLMQPNMLLGISLGVLCNLMFPGWLITLLLTITLGFVTFRSCKCGFRLWKDESDGSNEDQHGACDCGIDAFGVSKQDSNGSLNGSLEEGLLDPNAHESAVESRSSGCCCVGLPIFKFAALLVVWLFFFAVQLFRGSKTSEGYFHLAECGSGYWMITASQLPVTLIFSACVVWRAHKQSISNEKSKWTQSKAHFLLPIMAFLAGVLGGLLGIGGGMLISPVLLEIGMPPQVTAATSAFMVFFSSSLSVVQYWLMGRIPVEHALWFSTICFVFSLVGLLVVQRFILRYGRASIIVFLITSVMGLSALLMAGFGSLDVWRQYADGDYMGFRSPC